MSHTDIFIWSQPTMYRYIHVGIIVSLCLNLHWIWLQRTVTYISDIVTLTCEVVTLTCCWAAGWTDDDRRWLSVVGRCHTEQLCCVTIHNLFLFRFRTTFWHHLLNQVHGRLVGTTWWPKPGLIDPQHKQYHGLKQKYQHKSRNKIDIVKCGGCRVTSCDNMIYIYTGWPPIISDKIQGLFHTQFPNSMPKRCGTNMVNWDFFKTKLCHFRLFNHKSSTPNWNRLADPGNLNYQHTTLV